MPAPTARLVDLSQYGIHVNNRLYKCCRCGRSTRGYSEGYHADDLCSQCDWIKLPGSKGAKRREVYFYTPRTVWVIDPQVRQSTVRIIWEGQLANPAYKTICGIVKIDGVLYTTRGTGSVDLMRGGTCVRRDALLIDERHFRAILARQRP